jgi:hypothetical protein
MLNPCLDRRSRISSRGTFPSAHHFVFRATPLHADHQDIKMVGLRYRLSLHAKATSLSLYPES